MTLFFLMLLGVSLGIFFYQRSQKGKKPILKPSLPLTPQSEPEKPIAPPVPVPAPEPIRPKPPEPIVPPPFMPTPPTPWPQPANPIAQRMAEIAEELKEPELSEPKKEFLLPAAEPPAAPSAAPPDLPVG